MTTIEQSSFTRLLEAAELVRSGFPFNCYGDLKELHQAVEAARADRALYEAARAMEKALETIALESALDDYATIRNIACAALPKE